MNNGYSIYKPLRNLLRQYNLWSGLSVAYRFMTYLDYDRDLPQALAPAGVLTRADRLRKGLVQWEFEILIREMILNCPEQGRKNFQSVKDIAKCINLIKRIENRIYGAHEGEDDDVLYELVRIAHRQFPWQTGINRAFAARYHWLYRQPGLRECISKIFGMNITELMQISLSLTGHFMNNMFINTPINNRINGVDPEITDKFIDRLSIDVAGAKEHFQKFASYDINWAYTFNIFRDRPLLRCPNGRVACIIPDFLIRRVTSGVYYDLIKIRDVGSQYLGPAVQDLIGRTLLHFNKEKKFKILREERYGPKKSSRDSIDWIISDENAHVFIECKAARIRFSGMSDLKDRENIRQEFDRIRDFALQSYRTISDAFNGEYPHWKRNMNPCYLAIVTLEDWQSFGLHIEREVMRPLSGDLEKLGIDPKLPELVPMTFCAIADFEAALEICRIRGISNLFEKKSDGEYQQWSLGTFVTNHYREELRDFRPQAFDEEWDFLDPR